MYKWFDAEFIKKCQDNNIEPVVRENTLVLYCSKIPSTQIQEHLTKDVPLEHVFLETIKPDTRVSIKQLTDSIGAQSLRILEESKNKYKIYFTGNHLQQESPVWEELIIIANNDQYINSCKVYVNNGLVISFDRSVSKAISTRSFGKKFRSLPSFDGDIIEVIERLF